MTETDTKHRVRRDGAGGGRLLGTRVSGATNRREVIAYVAETNLFHKQLTPLLVYTPGDVPRAPELNEYI